MCTININIIQTPQIRRNTYVPTSFFFFVKCVKIFENAHFIRSYAKFTFNTFKGVKTSVRTIGRGYIEFIERTSFKKDNVLQTTEENVKLFERTYLSKYNEFFKQHSTAITYRFYINTIIYRNFYFFINKNLNKLSHDVQFFKIT
jgi:hypothetical protein